MREEIRFHLKYSRRKIILSTDFGDSKKDYDELKRRNPTIIPLVITADTEFSNTDRFTAEALGVTNFIERKPVKTAVRKALTTKLSTLFQGTPETIQFLVENTTTRSFAGEEANLFGFWRLRVDPSTPFHDKMVFNNHSIVFDCTRKRGRLRVTRVSLQIVSKRPSPLEGMFIGPLILVSNENLDDFFLAKEDFTWLLNLPKRRKALLERFENWENYLETYLEIIKLKQAWIAYRSLQRVNQTQVKLQISTRYHSPDAIKRFFTGDMINVLDKSLPDDENWLPDDDDADPTLLGIIAKGQKFKKYFYNDSSYQKKREWVDLLIDVKDEYVISEETDKEDVVSSNINNAFDRLSQEGLILNSVFLDQLPFILQQKAIRRLFDGQAVNPRLEDFIFDITEARSPIRREKIDPGSLIRTDLNPKQFNALEKALNSPDITLIQGPPGTGKTTVIAELCHQIALWGGKVLVVSQANLAVDNALKRLANQRVIMPIRLGKHVTEEAYDFTEENVVKRWFESVKTEVTKIVNQRELLLSNVSRLKEALDRVNEGYYLQQQTNEKIQSIKIDLNASMHEHKSLLETKENQLSEKIKIDKQLDNLAGILEKRTVPLYDSLRSLLEIYPTFASELNQRATELLKKGNLEENVVLGSLEIGEFLIIINELQKNNQKPIKILQNLKKVIDQTGNISSKEILSLNEQKQQLTDKITSTTDNDLMTQYSRELLSVNRQLEIEKSLITDKILGSSWQDELISLRTQIDLILKLLVITKHNEFLIQVKNLRKALQPKDEYLPVLDRLIQLIVIFQGFSFEIPEKVIDNLSLKERELQGLRGNNAELLEKTEIDIKQSQDEIITHERKIDEKNQLIQQETEAVRKNLTIIKGIISQESEIEESFVFNRESLPVLQQHYTNLLERQQIELAQSRRWINLQKKWNNKIENSATDEYENLVSTYIDLANVVGATCSETGKYKFHGKSEREFDLVIIDEVSKATPPEILMPMLLGKQIVLVGDHQQLPPLFRLSKDELPIHEYRDDENAQDLVKRFERLVTASYFQEMFEDAKEQLRERLVVQYRMHTTIMRAINQFYPPGYQLEQGLKEDNEKIRNYFVLKGKSGNLTSNDTHLVWVDTSYKQVNGKTARNIEGREEGKFRSRYNDYEVEIIRKILISLNKQIADLQLQEQKPPQKVALISFYAGQERKLRDMVKNLKQKSLINKIEYRIGTVDRFQGMERPVVIVSLVSSPTKGTPTEFVKEFRRINVAFSRSQALLIIVGSKSAFENVRVEIQYEKEHILRKYSYREIISAAESCIGGNYYARGYDIIE